MKKMYEEPLALMLEIEVEDVICTSAGDNDSSWIDGASFDIK